MSNGLNTAEDAEMAECDGEKVVTMMDVLQEQQEFEEDANAVLGASDDKNCTYSKGYIKRQAIYACLTCCTEIKADNSKRAGVCLACSLTCHENHELIELYTKRNFRCDCGNPKFNSHPCQFTSDKTDLNEENKYNQNFSGLYCICHRPYPDPTFEDEMIQCIMCEDWLHTSHLDAIVPGNDQYSEMVCKSCMEKNDFLHDYSGLAVNNEIADVDVISENKELNSTHNISVTNGDLDGGKLTSETKTEENVKSKESIHLETKKEENKINSGNKDINKEEVQSSSISKEDNKEKELANAIETKETQDDNKKSNNLDMDESSAEVTRKLDELIGESESTTSDNKEISNEASPSEESQVKDSEIFDKDISSSEKKDLTNTDNAEQMEKSNQHSEMEVEQRNEEKQIARENSNENTSETNTKTIVSEENISLSKDDISKMYALPTDEKINTNEKEEEVQDVNGCSKTEPIADKNEDIDTKVDNAKANLESSSDVENKSVSDSNKTMSLEKDMVTNNQNRNDLDKDKLLFENNSKTEDSLNEHKRKLSTDEVEVDSTIKKQKICCVRPHGVKKTFKGATFWPSNFRQKLCTCGECLSMYKDLSVLFLIDPEDTVTAYEALGKERSEGHMVSQYEKGLEALSSLDRIQQINALTEYNKMRDKLLDFLKSFKEKKEVVKEEDIKAFFAGMKPKREPDGVYFCR